VEEVEPTEIARLEGPPPGTILLGKYRVDGLLGIGGYGYVVRAHHLELGESLAIKILRDDREIDEHNLARFLREAQAIVRLKSEHVARVFDVGKLPNGAPYMVMELLEGEDLGQRIEKGGALDPTLAVDYILQACEALAETHAIGIVHRDIKPTNLFVAHRPDGTEIVKVLDFGISKAQRRDHEKSLRLTQTQSVLGTPAYMSPEQMRSAKSVDGRTDVWALGAVLYELVECELPFDADNFAELCVVVATQPPRPMARAPMLAPVILRCLAKSVEERYATVAELATALAPYATPAVATEYVPRIHRLLDRAMTEPAIAAMRSSSPSSQEKTALPAARRATPAPLTGDLTIEERRPRGHLVWIAAVVGILLGGTAALLTMKEPAAATDPPVAPAPKKAEPPPPAPSPPPTNVAPPAEVASETKIEPAPVQPTKVTQPPNPTRPTFVAPSPPVQKAKPDKPADKPKPGSARPCDPARSMMGC
jgi:serine/threonine-protein kinase